MEYILCPRCCEHDDKQERHDQIFKEIAWNLIVLRATLLQLPHIIGTMAIVKLLLLSTWSPPWSLKTIMQIDAKFTNKKRIKSLELQMVNSWLGTLVPSCVQFEVLKIRFSALKPQHIDYDTLQPLPIHLWTEKTKKWNFPRKVFPLKRKLFISFILTKQNETLVVMVIFEKYIGNICYPYVGRSMALRKYFIVQLQMISIGHLF